MKSNCKDFSQKRLEHISGQTARSAVAVDNNRSSKMSVQFWKKTEIKQEAYDFCQIVFRKSVAMKGTFDLIKLNQSFVDLQSCNSIA